MAELSHYGDGCILDSLVLPCASVSSAEAELQSLFHQLSSRGGFASEFLLGPEPARPDHSELFACWVQRLHAQAASADGEKREGGEERIDAFDRWLPFCPDLRRRIKKLVSVLVAARNAGLEKPENLLLKRRSDSMWNVLLMLKNAAVDPCHKAGTIQELKDQILRARKVLFLRADEVSISDMEEFPYRSRKRKARLCPSETSGGTEGEVSKQPKRRSQRTLGLLKICDSHLPRMRIPVGSSFQADVPDWTGQPIIKHSSDVNNVDSDDSRWLGTTVLPSKGYHVEISGENIGKGRADFCHCTHPGSVECIKIHVNSARLQLKSNLGSVFNCWGFDKMGEDVSKSWTSEEQTMFDNIVKLNPLSEDKSFLEPASKFFTSKSKKGIASYYYNVYVLRRMSSQTRVLSGTINSDDEEDNDKAYDLRTHAFVTVPEVSCSISSQSSDKVARLVRAFGGNPWVPRGGSSISVAPSLCADMRRFVVR